MGLSKEPEKGLELAKLLPLRKSRESIDVKDRVMDHSGFLKIVEKRVRAAIKNPDALGKCGAVTTVPL